MPLPMPRSVGDRMSTARPSVAMSWVAANRLVMNMAPAMAHNTVVPAVVVSAPLPTRARATMAAVDAACRGRIQPRRRPRGEPS